jgi:hypothetical protein
MIRDPLIASVEAIGDLTGRLNRAHPGFLVDRLAARVETLDAMIRPTAADRYRRGLKIEQALAEVDAEARALRRRMGFAEERPA